MHVAHNIEQDIARWEKLAEIVKCRSAETDSWFFFSSSTTQSVPICAFCGAAPRLYLPTAIVKGLVLWLPPQTPQTYHLFDIIPGKSVSGQLKGDTCDLLKVLAAQRVGQLRSKSWGLPAAKWRLLGSTVYRASGGLWTRSPYFHGCGPKV